MSASTAELVRTESAPGMYRLCATCQRRTHRDEMHDDWECQRCRGEYIEKQKRRKLTQELAEQKRAVGQAVNGMVTAIGEGKFQPNEPHVVYQGVLEHFGGVPGFCKIFRERFDAAANAPNCSHKVVLDYLKAVLVLGDVAQKTAPPPPNFNGMSDEEMADEFARLVQQKMEEIQELKMLGERPVVVPEDEEDRDTFKAVPREDQ